MTTMENRTSGDGHSLALAIVGIALRVPGASSVHEFWNLLQEGRESVGPALGEPDYGGGTVVSAKGILEGADEFDAAFFDMPPAEAEVVDPQHRIMLQLSWHALEDAGLTPHTAGRVGVFVGCAQSRYRDLLRSCDARLDERVNETQLRIATDVDFLASRVAYKLDCRGPALTIQTACSSSLVAVHEARLALLSGNCDTAIAGGVSITLPLDAGYRFIPGSIYAADGHCRPFDSSAGGVVPGDGGAVVVLRRLADALDDGDPIYCTLLGSAANNDGHTKLGFSAPSADGQSSVIRDALRSAGVQPEAIGFVEAHGTGTRLGDLVEIEGLKDVFGRLRHPASWCALGSIKGNMGHLNRAAGIVGLVKAVLSVRAGVIPPTVGFRSPHPDLHLAESPFRVASDSLPWPDARPRLAGVSSFGIGGTNAHVVIGELPTGRHDGRHACSANDAGRPAVLCISGRTAESARENALNLAAHLESDEMELAAVERTLDRGRVAFPWRITAVGSAVEELTAGLRRAEPHHAAAPSGVGLAFLFPGQGVGSPCVPGAGISAETAYAEVLARARLILSSDYQLWADKSDDRDNTSVLEVDLLVHQAATAAALAEHGVQASVLVGHSVGELAAAFVAGVFEFEEILELLIIRHEAIQSLCPEGSMVAARLDRAQAHEWTSTDIELAASNSEQITVFSGLVDPMQHLLERLKGAGISAQMLPVTRPFHSRWMEPAARHMRAHFARARLAAPKIPVVAASTGKYLSPELAQNPDHWVAQIVSPVRFYDAIGSAVQSAPTAIDLGPGEVLARLARSAGMTAVAIDRPLSASEVKAALWREGVTSQHERGSRVHLPGYAFARERHWPLIRQAEAPGSAATSSDTEPAPNRNNVPRDREVPDTAATLLSHVFTDILGGPAPAPHANFFDIGGDSLMAIQLVSRLREVVGVDLELADFFEDPSINGVLRRIAA